EYISVILDRRDEVVDRFLKEHSSVETQANHILRLLEMQRHAMLMFTSCGWFFDEVSGIETTQILQYACRAIQLANQVSDAKLEAEFIKKLEDVPSNTPMIGNAVPACYSFVVPSTPNLHS